VEDNLPNVPIVLNVNNSAPTRRLTPKCLAPEARSGQNRGAKTGNCRFYEAVLCWNFSSGRIERRETIETLEGI